MTFDKSFFDLAIQRRIAACLRAGYGSRYWYQEFNAALRTVADELGISHDSLIDAAAITSPRVQVNRSVKIAAEYLARKFKRPGGCMASTFERLEAWRADVAAFEWRHKIGDFRASILGDDIDAVCVDIHICRAFGFENGYPMQQHPAALTARGHIQDFIRGIVNHFEREYSHLYPREIQAAIWSGWISFNGGPVGVIDVDSIVEHVKGA